MEYILMFIIILINATMLKILLKNKIEENIPIAVIGIILITYIFGLFDKLKIGIIITNAITIVNFIMIIYYYIKKKNKINIKKDIITPGVIVYSVLWILFILFNKGRVFVEYDEFSHWGLIVKNMYETGSYGIGNIIEYSEYPPFVSIFQYILLMLKRTYSEDTIIIGLNILYLTFLIPLLKNIRWDKSLKKLIIYIPLILIIPIIFYENFYTTLFIDGFLACILSYIVYNWFNKKDIACKISIVLGSVALILSKSICIGYIIALFIMFIIDGLINSKDKKTRNNSIKFVLVVIIVTATFCATWNIKLNVNDATIKWNTEGISFQRVKDVLEGNGEYYQKVTIKKYLNELFIGRGAFASRNLNVINLLMLLIFFDIFVYNHLKEKESKKTYLIISIMLLITWSISIAILLIIYLFIFTPQEAMILACYERYLSVIPLAITLFNIFVLKENYEERELKATYICMIIAILIAFVPMDVIDKTYIKNNENKKENIEYRQKYSEILKYKNKIDKDSKVYYISNLVGNKDITIVKYEFLPFKIGNNNSKLTMTKEEFEKELKEKNYEYVYISTTDRFLEKDFSSLFENEKIEEGTMYKILDKDGKILFCKVE